MLWKLSFQSGAIANRLCNGLQIHLAQFDSGSRLQNININQQLISHQTGGFFYFRVRIRLARTQNRLISAVKPHVDVCLVRLGEYTSSLCGDLFMVSVRKTPGGRFELCVTHNLLPRRIFLTFNVESEALRYGGHRRINSLGQRNRSR